MTVIAEFLFGLGFSKIDPKPLDDAEKKARDAAKRMRDEWKSAAQDIGKSFAIAGAAATGAAFGLFKLAESSARAADEIGDTAQAMGVASRELQRLRHGVQIAGGNVDGFDKAIKKWTSGLSDAAAKGIGPVAERLDQLGLSAGALQGMGLEDQIALIADRFQGLASKSERAAIAADLFGAEADLKTLLDRSGAGVRALGDEAERLGLVLSDEALAAAGDFTDEVDRMRAQLGAIVRDVGLSLMPTISAVIKDIRDWALQNRELIKTRLDEVVRSVASAVQQLLPAVTALVPVLARTVEIAAQLTESAGPAGATGAFVAMRGAMTGALGPIGAVTAALAILISSVISAAEETQNLNFALDDLRQGGRGKRGEGTRFVSSKREGELQASRRALEQQLDVLDATRNKRMGDAGAGGEQAHQRDTARIVGQIKKLDAEIAKERSRVDDKAAFDADVQRRSEELEQRTQGRLDAFAARKKAERDAKKGGGGTSAAERERKRIEAEAKARAVAEFGEEAARLGASLGVGELGQRAAIEAGASAFAGGSVSSVAREAFLARLGGLAGKDLSSKTKDPLLSQIFGENVPDVELSTLAAGAQPQTLVVTINNTFDVKVENEINGAGNPAEVADQVNLTVDKAVRKLVADATRTVKLRNVR